MKYTARIGSSSRATLLAVGLVFGLAACEGPTHPADYREAYPITVSEETMVMPIANAFSENKLTVDQSQTIKGFVRDYISRGRGKMVIEVQSGGGRGKTNTATGTQVQDMLINAGMRRHELEISRGTGPTAYDAGAVVRYVAAKVSVKECGDFSSDVTANWTNRRHSNHGCATRRNLGLMVENPMDLVRPRPLSGADGERAVRVIQLYRSGEVTGAAKSGEQQQGGVGTE